MCARARRVDQLVTYEFAVMGVWVYGGVISGYLKYTSQEGSNANFDTISESLLSMFQVCVVVCVWLCLWL